MRVSGSCWGGGVGPWGSCINSGSSVIKTAAGSPGTFRRAMTIRLAHGLGIGVGTGGSAYVRVVWGEWWCKC